MDKVIHHKGLRERWMNESLAYQMANIGSEVSRSLKNRDNPKRFQGAYERALELFGFTIDSAVMKETPARLKEICRAREEFLRLFQWQ